MNKTILTDVREKITLLNFMFIVKQFYDCIFYLTEFIYSLVVLHPSKKLSIAVQYDFTYWMSTVDILGCCK